MSTVPQPFYPARTYRSTSRLVAVHAALWTAWLLGLFLFMPRWEWIYRDFNMRLPWTTEMVMSLTHGAVPVAVVIALLLLMVVEGAVYSRLRQSAPGWLVQAWSGAMTVLPVLAIFVTALAVWLPMLKLQEALSR